MRRSQKCNGLGRLGRHRDALQAAEKAVALLRDLAAAHQPDLAWALANLSAGLGRLGRDQEALTARTEEARIYRELADRDPDLYQSDTVSAWALSSGNTAPGT